MRLIWRRVLPVSLLLFQAPSCGEGSNPGPLASTPSSSESARGREAARVGTTGRRRSENEHGGDVGQPGVEEWIVWWRHGDRLGSHWLAVRGSEAKILATRNDAVFIDGEALWQVTPASKTIELKTCECADDPADLGCKSHGRATYTGYRIIDAFTKAEHAIGLPSEGVLIGDGIEGRAELLAGSQRRIVVRRFESGYFCGANEEPSVVTEAISLATAKPEGELWSKARGLASPVMLADAAKQLERAGDECAGEASGAVARELISVDAIAVALVADELRPVWTFATEPPEACAGDLPLTVDVAGDDWNALTTLGLQSELPPPFAGVVAKLAELGGGSTTLGWSRVDGSTAFRDKAREMFRGLAP